MRCDWLQRHYGSKHSTTKALCSRIELLKQQINHAAAQTKVTKLAT
jgi:hypothetical protein